MPSIADLMQTKIPESTGAMAQYPYEEKVAKKFRLKDKFGEPYLMYRSGNGKLWLPRALCPVGEKDNRTKSWKYDFDLKVDPRDDEQDRVIVEAYKFLEAGQSGIIQAPTGSGKTYMACAVTALMQRPTLVIVTKDDLFDQWIEAAHTFLGLPYKKIGQVRQDVCNFEAKPFVVGMIHSLAKEGKYPDQLRRAFGLVHFDEVHRLPADEFSKVAGMFSAFWRVGWSATTDRSDGKEIVFKAHIGPIRVVSEQMPMIPEVYRYKTKFKVPYVPNNKDVGPRVIRLPHGFGRITGLVSYMARDKARNKLIAKLASMCYKSGRRTVLFSDSLEHLEKMYELLVAKEIRASDIGWYVAGISKEQKQEAQGKKFLLATYGFMSEGSDIPSLDACILGMPRADIRQIAGRVIRVVEGKSTPIIIDLIDTDSTVLSAYADKRLKQYKAMGCTKIETYS